MPVFPFPCIGAYWMRLGEHEQGGFDALRIRESPTIAIEHVKIN
jgi:hypothetical protein